MAQIQVRRDTAANWTSANPTLSIGELAYETDTGYVKMGDGSTAWTSLAYGLKFQSILLGSGTIGNANFGYYPTDASNNQSIGSPLSALTNIGLSGAHANVAYGSGNNLSTTVLTGNLSAVTTGYDNTAIGAAVMNDATTAHSNTAVGTDCLCLITTGSLNVAVGPQAAQNLTTGTNLVAVGANAGNSVVTGTFNTAVGSSAMASAAADSTITQCVAIGSNSLTVAQAGPNTMVGHASGSAITTSVDNTGVGTQALFSHTTGNGNNTAVGHFALEALTTGYWNTAMGSNALGQITSGLANTAFGYYAGRAFTSSNTYNTCLGEAAGYTDGTTASGAGISNATLLGERAQSQISNVIVLGKGIATRPNLYFGIAPTTDKCEGGVGCFFIANAATNPTAAASAGGVILYASGGVLYGIGNSGVATAIVS